MGRFVVSEYIRIEVFQGIDVSAEIPIALDDFSRSNTIARINVQNNNSKPYFPALYREQFHSTSFILGERDGCLEMVFRVHPDNFLFDLEGRSYQIHVFFEPKYFSRRTVFQEATHNSKNQSNIPQDRTSIPQNLKNSFYQPLFVSCESQAVLYQMIQLEWLASTDTKTELDLKIHIQMESIAIRLLMDCLEVSERMAPLCDACSFLDKNESTDKVLEAMNFIQRNFRESITIPQIAKEVGINQCYLKKGFKEMYGKTIYTMVQSLRMELAHELLKKGSLNILEVALEVGYTNAASFSTAFKQFYGYSPQRLRTQ